MSKKQGFLNLVLRCSTGDKGCLEVCHNEMVPFSLDRLMQMKLFMLTLPTVVWYVVTQNEREKFDKAEIFKKDLKEKENEAAKKLEEEIKASAPQLSTSKDDEALLINSSVSLTSERKSGKNTTGSGAYLRIEKNPTGIFLRF